MDIDKGEAVVVADVVVDLTWKTQGLVICVFPSLSLIHSLSNEQYMVFSLLNEILIHSPLQPSLP